MSRSKFFSLSTVAAAGVLALTLAGCSAPAEEAAPADGTLGSLTVGATATPAGEIVQFVIDSGQAEAAGLELDIVEFTDYTTPNPALSEGSLDVNLFQHAPFLDLYNENTGDTLAVVGQVYLPPLALYSKTVDELADLPDGAKIALPNDASNEGRALLLLAEAGLIETTDAPSTVSDITANPNDYNFIEIDAASLPSALDDQDAAIVNFNYAGAAGLSGDLQLVTEGTSSVYYNVLATRDELTSDPRVTTLYELLTSDETKAYINDFYNGLVIPVS
ncbi:MetQ/NlpA family ABC transporter substrate-binding protein [Salinibacterium sp. SWN248]|uniref:MetQ/NlpA family ABC transporter substrate-binding protein n=1 Tax=Salinibacterium sp. SWN248 TaxID=2792056 RepID=UPI0018CDAD83|nr:MetQ/NlpA family ABC transporter substrate-binding protein [Salinibacterium sp. SWN248]MBH0023899.1 ABC transporter substrate-binding protein [Salinibacterium sp. SWN248]